VVTKVELAILRFQLAQLSPRDSEQLKWNIVAEKMRREAEALAKAKWSGDGNIGSPSLRKIGSAGVEEVPRASAKKSKADELDLSHRAV
jgi:hypothetical protein